MIDTQTFDSVLMKFATSAMLTMFIIEALVRIASMTVAAIKRAVKGEKE